MRIPVVLAARTLPVPAADDVLLRLEPPVHAHAGDICAACAAAGDVRVALYELLERRRLRGDRLPARVVIDARHIGNAQPTIDRLNGNAAATALRDHTVARAFALVEIV